MKIEDYEIVIRPLTPDDGSGFFAFVPDPPGCHLDGETPHEALTNVYDAFACWIEGMQEMGAPIPQLRRLAA